MLRFLALISLFDVSMQAQSPDASLQAAKQKAAALLENLPAYTCNLKGINERLQEGKTHDHVTVTGMLDVRHPDAQSVTANWRLTFRGGWFNLNPMKAYFSSADFMEVEGHLMHSVQSCYRFEQAADGVYFTSTDSAAPLCQNERGIRGRFTLNAAGDIEHAERTQPGGNVTFAAIDLQPVALETETRRLPVHFIAEQQTTEGTKRFDVDYSDCHIFVARVTCQTPHIVDGTDRNPNSPK